MFEHFPTTFAMKIAYRLKLIMAPDFDSIKILEREMLTPGSGHTSKDVRNLYIELNQLQEFQELCVASNFEDCLVAYHDQPLTDAQKAALLIIHKATPTYIVGHLTNNLLHRVKDSATLELIQLTSAVIAILKDDKIGMQQKEAFRNQAKRFVVSPKISSIGK